MLFLAHQLKMFEMHLTLRLNVYSENWSWSLIEQFNYFEGVQGLRKVAREVVKGSKLISSVIGFMFYFHSNSFSTAWPVHPKLGDSG